MFAISGSDGDFSVRMPSFWQLVKAGMAFTIGAAVVTLAGAVCWVLFIYSALLTLAVRGR